MMNDVETNNLKDMILNIRNNVDVIHSDYSESGIYSQQTIYLWTYLGTEKKVENTVNKLYPGVFHIFEPSRVKDKNCENKIILKINKTLTKLEVIEEEKKETWYSKCVVS